MCWRSGLFLGAFLLPVLARSSDIYQLRGEPDYRFITLHWQYPTQLAGLHGFQINYCELQAWGPNRCRSKFLDATTGMPFMGDPEFRVYTVIVSGLRMATNYSFEVQPRDSRKSRFYIQTFPRWNQDPAAERIIIPTKGFSARASLCLPEVSEVEVSTGPHFSGRIAVESPSAETHLARCSVDGDGASPSDTYKLTIDHRLCGSKVNRTAVETFILVQENLPILTHSTRRFLVLCTFQPEHLTVTAGLSLPSTSPGASGHGTSSHEAAAVDEVVDNNVQASALLQADEAARTYQEQATEAQAAMFTVIVAAGLVAIGLGVWWFIPIKSKSSSSRESIMSDDTIYTSNSTVIENYENSLRDSVLDFETAEENCDDDVDDILREGVCNQVLAETCSSLALEPLPTVTIECATHSEA